MKSGRRLLLYASPFGERTESAWNSMSEFQQLGLGLRLVVNAMMHGSRMWLECDPVWHVSALSFFYRIGVLTTLLLCDTRWSLRNSVCFGVS